MLSTTCKPIDMSETILNDKFEHVCTHSHVCLEPFTSTEHEMYVYIRIWTFLKNIVNYFKSMGTIMVHQIRHADLLQVILKS